MANPLPPKTTDRPLRVLHLIHWLTRGGIESWLMNVLERTDRSRMAIDICCKGPGEGYLAPEVRKLGAEVIRCPQSLAVLPFVNRLSRLIKQREYDLLHLHTHFHSGPAVRAAMAAGVPSINTHHSLVYFPETALSRVLRLPTARATYAKLSMRYALRNATIATGVSQGVVDAVEHGAGLVDSGCRVFHLGVKRPERLDERQRKAYREELRLPAGGKVVMHVGSFTPPKNHPALLAAFRRLLDRLPDTTLILAGDGLLRPEVEAGIREHRLQQHVRVLGLRTDAPMLMQLADLFLFPSVTEGLSLALMEAHAVGLPVVASNIPGNVEACDNGTLARLHDPHDVQGLAESAIEVLQDPALAAAMGEKGRAYFEGEFSLNASIDRMTALYSEALGRDLPAGSLLRAA